MMILLFSVRVNSHWNGIGVSLWIVSEVVWNPREEQKEKRIRRLVFHIDYHTLQN